MPLKFCSLLSDEEKRKLFAAVAPDKRLTSIVLIGLLTEWRKSQILEVRKIDLDFINKAVTIKKSKQSTTRKVSVCLMAWGIFVNLAENTEDYLFVNRDGKPLGDFKDSWWKVLSEAGIKNFHFHDLRHTFTTDMITGGARLHGARLRSDTTTSKRPAFTRISKTNICAPPWKLYPRKTNTDHYTIFTPS
jgi:integrase